MKTPQIPLDYNTFRMSGLLWKINHDLLHPLGLALAVEGPGVGGQVTLSVLVSEDGEWQFDDDVDEATSAMFDRWYQRDVMPLFDLNQLPQVFNNGNDIVLTRVDRPFVVRNGSAPPPTPIPADAVPDEPFEFVRLDPKRFVRPVDPTEENP